MFIQHGTHLLETMQRCGSMLADIQPAGPPGANIGTFGYKSKPLQSWPKPPNWSLKTPGGAGTNLANLVAHVVTTTLSKQNTDNKVNNSAFGPNRALRCLIASPKQAKNLATIVPSFVLARALFRTVQEVRPALLMQAAANAAQTHSFHQCPGPGRAGPGRPSLHMSHATARAFRCVRKRSKLAVASCCGCQSCNSWSMSVCRQDANPNLEHGSMTTWLRDLVQEACVRAFPDQPSLGRPSNMHPEHTRVK